MIKICDPHPQRGDREVIDENGKVLGFVWKWNGSWVARIGDQWQQSRRRGDGADGVSELSQQQRERCCGGQHVFAWKYHLPQIQFQLVHD